MKILKISCVWIVSVLFAVSAFGQNYPSKPIRFIVTFAAGGGTDIVARVLGRRLSEKLGQPVVIENRIGAGGNIGTRMVAAAKPDGYTILVNSNAYLVNPAISSNAGYDPLRDFIPIVNAGSTPTVLVAHPSVKSSSLKELISSSKETQLFYSSAGVGTVPYMLIENMKKREQWSLIHVPFSGASLALNAVVSGQVPLAALSGETSGLKDFIQSGRLRALTVTSAKRWTQRPEIPTIVEMGFPSYVTASWIGLFAPAGTPKDIIGLLNREFNSILMEAETSKQIGRDYQPNTSEEFAASNKIEFENWLKIAIQLANQKD